MSAQRAGCSAFVGAGSQAEYARSVEPLTEESPTGPTTLYGAAKLATHCLLSQLAATHGVRFAWLRIFSVYGPEDSQTTLVSYVTTELLNNRRPAVSQGTQLWDYLYIEDAARAITMAASLPASGIYNVAHGSAQPLRDTILMIRNEINPELPIGFGEAGAGDNAMQLQASVAKLKTLGWSPAMPLDAGLRLSIAWHSSKSNVRC
jgi:nucleoside-diphosphate-sugar epimerase